MQGSHQEPCICVALGTLLGLQYFLSLREAHAMTLHSLTFSFLGEGNIILALLFSDQQWLTYYDHSKMY